MAAELSIDADELMSEIRAFRGEVNATSTIGAKLDEMMDMMEGRRPSSLLDDGELAEIGKGPG